MRYIKSSDNFVRRLIFITLVPVALRTSPETPLLTHPEKNRTHAIGRPVDAIMLHYPRS